MVSVYLALCRIFKLNLLSPIKTCWNGAHNPFQMKIKMNFITFATLHTWYPSNIWSSRILSSTGKVILLYTSYSGNSPNLQATHCNIYNYYLYKISLTNLQKNYYWTSFLPCEKCLYIYVVLHISNMKGKSNIKQCYSQCFKIC